MIQVGIVGYGLSGQIFHGALLETLPAFQVQGIATSDSAKQLLAAKHFPSARVFTDADQLISLKTIDLVVIATPNRFHHALARKALLAGKHVVVEKPFTVSVAEAADLMETAQRTQRLLTVYHNRRFDSDFLTLKQVLSGGSLGEIRLFEAAYDRFRPDLNPDAWREQPQPGSGILYDLGSHLIDQALALFGMPESLFADIRSLRSGQADDHFEIILDYPQLKVTLLSRPLVKEPLPRFAVHGTRGSYVKYGLDVQEAALRAGMRKKNDSWGQEPESQWGTLHTIDERRHVTALPGNYHAFYEALAAAILKGAPLPVTAQEGKQVIQLIENARESHERGCRVKIATS
ncbi:oxidoreductase [Anoxynatronum buryatiense]|uniref:Scyllo-inositol 2-dehydrogenase (NADP+) n=1 Tax=Anoxynatronum buryatiense TaxID=489973 RepID=A0AA45WX75_9CLOT|nr:oxidoreductase [Anoxynatronum buryatiense]SMP62529.1 scyllo-inositol 2-dehydrogenase (NADP+) [Anoxynatronum buryatiense]